MSRWAVIFGALAWVVGMTSFLVWVALHSPMGP